VPDILKAPFPYFGGKARVAATVWERFGDVPNYVEPFAGSLAILLGRPTDPGTETVNDLDCFIANFWRALRDDPEGVAEHADWPVNEADLEARHRWLVNHQWVPEQVKTDPGFHDSRVAGWWVWGISQWIGSGWCCPSGEGHRKKQLPHLGDAGRGVCRQLPHLGDAGRGVCRKRPHLGDDGMGVRAYLQDLAVRLRRVRVCCGDFERVLGPSVTTGHGLTGVFLDPPYSHKIGRSNDCYGATDDATASGRTRAWVIANQDNPLLRIAICGYEGEHDLPGWDVVKWKTQGGYGSQSRDGTNENAHRERIWFSPNCIKPVRHKDILDVIAEGTT
jgi:hypothetical protein